MTCLVHARPSLTQVGSRRAIEHRVPNLVDYLRHRIPQPALNECFFALFLDAESRWLGEGLLGQGSTGSLHFRMRDLFAEALQVHARSLLIAHNHPSGDCRPSRSDITATQRIKQVASALDIELLDHLIFTRQSVYSMRAGGDL